MNIKEILRFIPDGWDMDTLNNKGIVNIRLPHYEAINHIFARRGITDVWTTEEA